jgi:hypothetical protein
VGVALIFDEGTACISCTEENDAYIIVLQIIYHAPTKNSLDACSFNLVQVDERIMGVEVTD